MTQSPSLPELPKLPEPDGYAAISTDGTHSIVVPPQDFAKHNGYAIFTADQMNAHYLKGYEAGRASRAQSEWQTPPASWRLLAKAAIDLLWAIDTKHDTEKPPTKYAIPYGAVNNLRQALGCAEDPPLAPTQGAEVAAAQAVVGEASEPWWVFTSRLLPRSKPLVAFESDLERGHAEGWNACLAEARILAKVECERRATLTPSPTPTAPQEADALREALQKIVDEHADGYGDAQAFERIARAALAQHQPQQGDQHV